MENDILMCISCDSGEQIFEHTFSMTKEMFDIYNSIIMASEMLEYKISYRIEKYPKFHSGVIIENVNQLNFINFYSNENNKLTEIKVGYIGYYRKESFDIHEPIEDPIGALKWVLEEVAKD